MGGGPAWEGRGAKEVRLAAGVWLESPSHRSHRSHRSHGATGATEPQQRPGSHRCTSAATSVPRSQALRSPGPKAQAPFHPPLCHHSSPPLFVRETASGYGISVSHALARLTPIANLKADTCATQTGCKQTAGSADSTGTWGGSTTDHIRYLSVQNGTCPSVRRKWCGAAYMACLILRSRGFGQNHMQCNAAGKGGADKEIGYFLFLFWFFSFLPSLPSSLPSFGVLSGCSASRLFIDISSPREL